MKSRRRICRFPAANVDLLKYLSSSLESTQKNEFHYMARFTISIYKKSISVTLILFLQSLLILINTKIQMS